MFIKTGVKLTASELGEYEENKRILKIAEERAKLESEIPKDSYYIPEGEVDEEGRIDLKKREKLLAGRFEADEKIVTEQDTWEEEQQARALTAIGKENSKREGDDYELLIEDPIEFVETELMQGKVDDDEEVDTSVTGEERRMKNQSLSLQETRRSLPIFPYREQLLEAVRDHQVLVIVGETGSGKTTQIPQYLHEDGFTKV